MLHISEQPSAGGKQSRISDEYHDAANQIIQQRIDILKEAFTNPIEDFLEIELSPARPAEEGAHDLEAAAVETKHSRTPTKQLSKRSKDSDSNKEKQEHDLFRTDIENIVHSERAASGILNSQEEEEKAEQELIEMQEQNIKLKQKEY